MGETSTDWPEGPVGVVQAAETMGVAEGQAQRDGMNIERTSGCRVCQCHVQYCSHEQLTILFEVLPFLFRPCLVLYM